MSNVFERHAAFTLLGVFVTSATMTWVFLTFVLDDNKINYYKAQTESAQAEISLYKAKAENLEKDNENLKNLNVRYLDWVSKSKDPILFYQKELEKLNSENLLLKNGSVLIPQEVIKSNHIDSVPKSSNNKYLNTKRMSKSEAYTDDISGIVIGVSDIGVYETATLEITLIGRETYSEVVKVGKVINYKGSGKSYRMIITRIDYVSGYVTLQIKEM